MKQRIVNLYGVNGLELRVGLELEINKGWEVVQIIRISEISRLYRADYLILLKQL